MSVKKELKDIKRRIIRAKGVILSLLSSVRPIYKVIAHIFKRCKIVKGTEKRHFQELLKTAHGGRFRAQSVWLIKKIK